MNHNIPNLKDFSRNINSIINLNFFSVLCGFDATESVRNKSLLIKIHQNVEGIPPYFPLMLLNLMHKCKKIVERNNCDGEISLMVCEIC